MRRKQRPLGAQNTRHRYTPSLTLRRTPSFPAPHQVHPVVAHTLAYLDALLAHPLAPSLLLALAPSPAGMPPKSGSPTPHAASQSAPVAGIVSRVLTELESGLDAKARTCKCKVRRIYVFFFRSRAGSSSHLPPSRLPLSPLQILAAVFTLNNVTYAMATAGSSPTLASHAAGWLATHDKAVRWGEETRARACWPASLPRPSPPPPPPFLPFQIDARLRDLRAVLWAPTADAVSAARVAGTLSKDVAKAVAAGLAALDDARAAYAVVDGGLRDRVRDAVERELVVPYEVRREERAFVPVVACTPLFSDPTPPSSPSAPTATPRPAPCATRPPRCGPCCPTSWSCATTATRPPPRRARVRRRPFCGAAGSEIRGAPPPALVF